MKPIPRFESKTSGDTQPVTPLMVVLFSLMLVPGSSTLAGEGSDVAWTVVYEEAFQDVDSQSVGPDFFVVEGEFALANEDGNGVMRVSAGKSENFRVLLGQRYAGRQRFEVLAKVEGNQRLQSVFGLGLLGSSGFDLWLVPSREALELRFSNGLMAEAPIEWKADVWWRLVLELEPIPSGAQLKAKAWRKSGNEPQDWMVLASCKGILLPGRASLSGISYEGSTVSFDSLKLSRIEAQIGP